MNNNKILNQVLFIAGLIVAAFLAYFIFTTIISIVCSIFLFMFTKPAAALAITVGVMATWYLLETFSKK